MNRKIEVIAYHGWGMSSDFWKPWDELFGDNVVFKKNDRGYFHEPVHHKFENDEAIHVLFIQGFGMHWVSRENWKKAHLIVMFSTFNNLKDVLSKGRKLNMVIENLELQIDKQVYSTIESFWDFMFRNGHDFVSLDDLDVHDKELLKSDLESYRGNLVSKIPFNKRAKVVLYETNYDEVMNFSQHSIIASIFGKINHYKCFDFVGHGFPFTHARECFEDLRNTYKVFK